MFAATGHPLAPDGLSVRPQAMPGRALTSTSNFERPGVRRHLPVSRSTKAAPPQRAVPQSQRSKCWLELRRGIDGTRGTSWTSVEICDYRSAGYSVSVTADPTRARLSRASVMCAWATTTLTSQPARISGCRSWADDQRECFIRLVRPMRRASSKSADLCSAASSGRPTTATRTPPARPPLAARALAPSRAGSAGGGFRPG